MEFTDSGYLRTTDYFTCEEGALSGRAWLGVRNSVWHLLMPTHKAGLLRIDRAVALPLTAREEPAGWHWGLWLNGEVNLRISLQFIFGSTPRLPEKGARMERTLITYGYFMPGREHVQYNFGHFDFGTVPVLKTSPLSIIRPMRQPNGKWDWKNFVS